MPITNTQEVYEIRSISPVHINPSIMEGRHLYDSTLGPNRAVSIVRYAPIFLFNPVLTGDPGIPNTLYCSPGVVDASPSPSRHYQWYIDDEPSIGGEGVAFASFNTNALMDNKVITCVVTATNVLGSASATSNGILVNLIEPVVVGEYTSFGITGLSATESVTVFQDQIHVLTGMWVDEFLTAFEGDAFAITGLGMQDHITADNIDIYATEMMTLLDDITFSNSGAESDLFGWTTTAGTIQVITTANVPPSGGTKVWRGAPTSNTYSAFERIISIPSGNHDEIDTGTVSSTMGYWTTQSGNVNREHSIRGYYQILDASDNVLKTVDNVGVVFPGLNIGTNNPNFWNFVHLAAESVPIGARKIKLIFEFPPHNHVNGNICQLDQISLQLYQPV